MSILASVGSALGSFASSAGGKLASSLGSSVGGGLLSGLTGYYFGGKSEKRSNERSEQMTRRMMYESANLDALYGKNLYQWQRNLDYQYDSQQYYDLARKYAQNSAKWQVTGLRNANLNPILAATDGNFRGTFGTGPSTGGSIPSHNSSASKMSSAGSNTNIRFDSVLDGMRNLASADQASSSAELAKVNTRTAQAMLEPTVSNARADAELKKASADKLRADAFATDCNSAKTIAETTDIENGKNISGFWNVVGRALVPFLKSDKRTDKSNARQVDKVKMLRDGVHEYQEYSARQSEPKVQIVPKGKSKSELRYKSSDEEDDEVRNLRYRLMKSHPLLFTR